MAVAAVFLALTGVVEVEVMTEADLPDSHQDRSNMSTSRRGPSINLESP